MAKAQRARVATKKTLPRKAVELERLATYYDTHDTSAEMQTGERVEPQPMVTTSLRLPAALASALRAEARGKAVRYTVLLRRILEEHLRRAETDELREIRERLTRVERQVSRRGARA